MFRARSLLLVFLLAASGAGGRHFKLEGRILSAEGRPFPGAWVSLRSLDSPYFRERHCDRTGHYRFDKLAAGQYALQVKARGRAAVLLTLDLTRSFADAKGVIHHDLRLPAASLEARQREWTVPARRLALPAAAEKAYRRALREAARGHAGKAMRHLRQALKLAPDFVEAANDLGTYYHRRGKYRQAIRLFRQAARGDPRAFSPQVNLGGSLLAARRLEEAVEANRRAVALDPRSALAQGQLGLSYYLLGRYRKAEAHLEETRRLDPGSALFPQLLLARIAIGRGQEARAVRYWEEFLRLHPDLPSAEGVRRELERVRARRRRRPAPEPPSQGSGPPPPP